jgi:hypothetical protein
MALLFILGIGARSLDSNSWDAFAVIVTVEGRLCNADKDIKGER